MKSKRLVIVVSVTLAVLGSFLSVIPVNAAGNTWHVGGGPVAWQQPDIQTAVNVATTNDKIIVHAGTYNEHVVIPRTKSHIKIIGDGATLDGVSCTLPYGFELVGADYIAIMNFTIMYYSTAGICIHEDWSSGALDPALQNKVTDNRIQKNCGDGIQLRFSHSNKIANNDISRNSGHGIHAFFSDFNKIGPNGIHDNSKHGIFIDTGNRNQLKDCNDIFNNGWSGIELHSAVSTIVGEALGGPDVVGNHGMGLFADSNSHDNVIVNSRFLNNWHSGIWVEGSYNTIQGNIATGHGYDGIHIRGGDHNFVCYNDASYNRHDGICVMYDPGTWDIAEWNCICYNTALYNWYDLVFSVPPGTWQANWYNNHWDFNIYNVATVSYWPPIPWNPPPCPTGCPCPCC